MKEVFVVIGKLPLKGLSKTRLAKSLGEENALILYESFIRDFFKNLSGFLNHRPMSFYFFGTPNDEKTRQYFCDCFDEFSINPHTFLFQKEWPFFERLEQVFNEVNELEGECFIHLTGTDIPDFPFKELKKVNPKKEQFFVGPDSDGGFYYLGCESKWEKIFRLDGNLGIFNSLKRNIEDLGYNVESLGIWSDIDDESDLKKCLDRSDEKVIACTQKAYNSIPR